MAAKAHGVARGSGRFAVGVPPKRTATGCTAEPDWARGGTFHRVFQGLAYNKQIALRFTEPGRATTVGRWSEARARQQKRDLLTVGTLALFWIQFLRAHSRTSLTPRSRALSSEAVQQRAEVVSTSPSTGGRAPLMRA